MNEIPGVLLKERALETQNVRLREEYTESTARSLSWGKTRQFHSIMKIIFNIYKLAGSVEKVHENLSKLKYIYLNETYTTDFYSHVLHYYKFFEDKSSFFDMAGMNSDQDHIEFQKIIISFLEQEATDTFLTNYLIFNSHHFMEHDDDADWIFTKINQKARESKFDKVQDLFVIIDENKPTNTCDIKKQFERACDKTLNVPLAIWREIYKEANESA